MSLWFLEDQASAKVPRCDHISSSISTISLCFKLFLKCETASTMSFHHCLNCYHVNTLPLKNGTSFWECYPTGSASAFNPFLAQQLGLSSKTVSQIMSLICLKSLFPTVLRIRFKFLTKAYDALQFLAAAYFYNFLPYHSSIHIFYSSYIDLSSVSESDHPKLVLVYLILCNWNFLNVSFTRTKFMSVFLTILYP